MTFWIVVSAVVGLFFWAGWVNGSEDESYDSFFGNSYDDNDWNNSDDFISSSNGFLQDDSDSFSDDNHCPSVNPANGLPMMNCSFDIEGNAYGTDSDDYWESSSDSWDYSDSFDDSFSSFDDDSFSSFDDDW